MQHEPNAQPTAPQVVYVKKESWILQLAALALWTLFTCAIAYMAGLDAGREGRPAPTEVINEPPR